MATFTCPDGFTYQAPSGFPLATFRKNWRDEWELDNFHSNASSAKQAMYELSMANIPCALRALGVTPTWEEKPSTTHKSIMTNAQINYKFFQLTNEKVKEGILRNICINYGIEESEALDEIFNPEAEHLLDYLTGSTRSAIHLIMKGFGLA